MATVTPNFNWPVPTSTDLVKDGATAIEALGDSIDASMVDLKGGTTGQVLAKASNTDMDFTWVTDAAGDIQGVTVTSPLTGGGTSGTVTVGILSGTTSNLGAVQLSDSTSSTSTTLAATANAVKTAYDLAASAASGSSTNVAGKNVILNSNFSVWQRGTSIAAQQVGFNYVADRWGGSCNTSGAATVSRQVTGDTTNLPFIQYCARYQRDAGNTATGIQYLNQPIETVNSIPLAGKTVTVSFYARRGANFSAASNILTCALISGTGTDQNYLGTWTGAVTVATTNATLTSTWQRFQFSGTVGATATELTLPFTYTPTGTAGANDYYEVTGVQLEIASSATAYSPNTSTQALELAACQRYYFQTFVSAATESTNKVSSYSDANYGQGTRWPVQMRVAPSVTVYSSNGGTANRVRQISNNTNYTPASISDIGVNGFNIFTGIALSNMIDWHYTASAEL
jgi:hypothetical protein